MANETEFDLCIASIRDEITEIEEGRWDEQLETIAKYPIKNQFINTVGIYCKFPDPPNLSSDDNISDAAETSSQISAVDNNETKQSKINASRKSDALLTTENIKVHILPFLNGKLLYI
jgi:hypothetical protein